MFRKQQIDDWAVHAGIQSKQIKQLAASIERVRELHKPFGENNEWCDHCEIGQNSGYEWADYPCPTIQALDLDLAKCIPETLSKPLTG